MPLSRWSADRLIKAALGQLAIFLLVSPAIAQTQQDNPAQKAISVRSTIVLVPTLVKTKRGSVVLDLNVDDFSLTDNGIPEKLTLNTEADSEPMAAAIVVQTGGAGAQHLPDYDNLGGILDSMLGGVDHRVSVIGFDSSQHVVLPFTPDLDRASRKLSELDKGDSGAAILDAVAFAVGQLRTQPANYRRAILLFSETIDHGSKTALGEALRLVSNTNTTLYSFSFRSTRAALSHEADKFGYGHATEPGPPKGCFSRDGADAEYDGHYSRQVLDCLSQLAPPLRLATMAFLTARNGLRTNTASSLAELTGGEFFPFDNGKRLRERLIEASQNLLNYYVLGFRPTSSVLGPHALRVEVKGRPELSLKFRTEYWLDDADR